MRIIHNTRKSSDFARLYGCPTVGALGELVRAMQCRVGFLFWDKLLDLKPAEHFDKLSIAPVEAC